ncbi:prepilin-type N-terminal cleavage/methylation domain-containing protein [Bacillus sp. FJAT-42315]|uniref:prepilin-type N-terminal cleavage/methylation domain-containing protein n=1 Tax=Bacillus sp. FJAT-42315 TaxID=2014077 RepID=UPI0012FECF25|nr:prepilin-type N-terminal cleavage/methylation domain-containing protein [Bacillus sp. FJAT-42315]
MKHVRSCEKGVTLLELLLSLTILSIVLLSVTQFFYQSATFNHSNQNKTVALNVARNALMYMEKQNFIEMRHSFGDVIDNKTEADQHYFELMICNNQYELINGNDDSEAPPSCSNIIVNNEPYTVFVFSEPVAEEGKKKHYIPIKIEVEWDKDGKKQTTALDGTIKSEDLR